VWVYVLKHLNTQRITMFSSLIQFFFEKKRISPLAGILSCATLQLGLT
jgi:hypothetical protein